MKKILFLALVLFGLNMSDAQAQRIAYVDLELILDQLPEYKSAQEQLDKIADEWRQQAEAKMKEVEEMYQRFQAEQVLLTDAMKQKRIEEIEQKEREVKQFQRAKFAPSGELFKKRQELIKPIQDKVYDAIQKLASTKGYDMILDKSSGAGVLFASPRLDKTEDVVKALK